MYKREYFYAVWITCILSNTMRSACYFTSPSCPHTSQSFLIFLVPIKNQGMCRFLSWKMTVTLWLAFTNFQSLFVCEFVLHSHLFPLCLHGFDKHHHAQSWCSDAGVKYAGESVYSTTCFNKNITRGARGSIMISTCFSTNVLIMWHIV